MAKKPTEGRRKLVEFDPQTWHALNLLSRETMKSFGELADEAFRDAQGEVKGFQTAPSILVLMSLAGSSLLFGIGTLALP
jgi:hypothetical protein